MGVHGMDLKNYISNSYTSIIELTCPIIISKSQTKHKTTHHNTVGEEKHKQIRSHHLILID